MRLNSAARLLLPARAWLLTSMLLLAAPGLAQDPNPNNGTPLTPDENANVQKAIDLLKSIAGGLTDEAQKKNLNEAIEAIEKAKKGKPGEIDPETEKPIPPRPGIFGDRGWPGPFGAYTHPETVEGGVEESTEGVLVGQEAVFLSVETLKLSRELLAPILAHEGRRLVQKDKRPPANVEEEKQNLRNEINALETQILVWDAVIPIIQGRIGGPYEQPGDPKALSDAMKVRTAKQAELEQAKADLKKLNC